MATIFGRYVPDEFIRAYNAGDINTRIAMLRFVRADDLIDQAVAQWVNENYGYMGAILQIPEINSLLMQAGREGWSEQRIQGAITQTAFWRTHTAAERNWLQLQASDPAEAQRQLQTATQNVQVLAQRLGVTIPASRMQSIAQQVASGAVTDAAQIQRMVAAEAQLQNSGAPGSISAGASEIRARAQAYGLRVTDQAAFDWSVRIASGTADAESVDEFFRQQAKARFANNPDILRSLEAGLTLREAMDPQLAQVADTLEIDADSVNLTDARWSALIDYADPESGVRRAMTVGEANQFARQQDEYRETRGANVEAATMAERIAQRFGAVA